MDMHYGYQSRQHDFAKWKAKVTKVVLISYLSIHLDFDQLFNYIRRKLLLFYENREGFQGKEKKETGGQRKVG